MAKSYAAASTSHYFLTVHRRHSTNYIFKTLPVVFRPLCNEFTLDFYPRPDGHDEAHLQRGWRRVIAVHASSSLVSSINISTQKTRLVRVLRFAVLNF